MIKEYTYETCREVSLKYNNKTDFRKYDNDYFIVSKMNNWINDFTWLLVKCREKFTYDECKNIISKYKNISEFKKNDYRCYNYCLKNNWIEDLKNYIKKEIGKKWTYEKCKKYIEEHPELKQRQYKCYQAIKKYNWNDLLPKNNHKLTYEYCKSIECKYDNINDLYVNNLQVYKKMQRMKWLSLKSNKNWDIEKCIEFAKTCKSRSDLHKKSRLVYYHISKMNLLEKIFPNDERVKYDKNECIINARKYKCRYNLSSKNNNLYQYLVKHNLLEKVFPKISLKEYFRIAKTYNSKTELKYSNRHVYEKVHNYKNIDEYFKNKLLLKRELNKHIKIANTCNNLNEFKTKYNDSYKFLLKNKKIKELF